METLKNKWILYGAAIVVILSAFGILKYSGFHFQNGVFVRGGAITVVPHFETDLRVFLDNSRVTYKENADGTLALLNIAPGAHSLLVFKDNYWPWFKDIDIVSDAVVTIAPFVISKEVHGVIIPSDDREYGTITRAIRNAAVPLSTTPLSSQSGTTDVWVEGTSVWAKWRPNTEPPSYFCNGTRACPDTVEVTQIDSGIRSIAFYKNRDDILLIATQNGIFAIELDKRGNTQNFQPVYKGAALPTFAPKDENTLYVQDGAIVFIITI